MKLGDNAPVDALDGISVRMGNLKMTVGEIRRADLAVLGFRKPVYREDLDAALAAWDAGGAAAWVKEDAVRRVALARETWSRLDAVQRATLFRELGQCMCSEAATLKNPAVGVGGALGDPKVAK